jgi:hypothetical protein
LLISIQFPYYYFHYAIIINYTNSTSVHYNSLMSSLPATATTTNDTTT